MFRDTQQCLLKDTISLIITLCQVMIYFAPAGSKALFGIGKFDIGLKIHPLGY